MADSRTSHKAARWLREMRAKFLFEPRDLWIGVYWTFDDGPGFEVWHRADGTLSEGPSRPGDRQRTHRERDLVLYLCIVPLFPIRVTLPWREWVES